jgi:tetratricopeptide (TPR) repeat protein
MNDWRRLALTATIMALGSIKPALAETSSSWAICTDSAAPSRDRQIDACTAVIAARHTAKAELAIAYYNRGHAYTEKNWPVRARIDFERALALKPNYPEALVGRGELLTQRNKWREAVWDYDRAIQLKPDLADAYADRAIAFDTLHQFDRAVADFDRALALRPNDPWLESLREGARRANGDAGRPDSIARAKDAQEKPSASLDP